MRVNESEVSTVDDSFIRPKRDSWILSVGRRRKREEGFTVAYSHHLEKKSV